MSKTHANTDTDTRNAEQVLAELRRKLEHWEHNLSANRDHYWAAGNETSGIKCEQQLEIIESVFDIIGK